MTKEEGLVVKKWLDQKREAFGDTFLFHYDPMFCDYSFDSGTGYANAYQFLSRRTQSTELSLEDKRRHALFGLCSEVGEIHSIFQHEYQGKPASKEKVIDECGDLLWFLCELCDSFFINLSDVMEYNINKLKARYPQGFDVERSERRHDNDQA